MRRATTFTLLVVIAAVFVGVRATDGASGAERVPGHLSAGHFEVARASPAAWKPGVEQARAWARRRKGTVSFAIRTRSGMSGLAAHRVYRSASVVKAMLLVTYLNSRAVRSRGLERADRRLLAPMITWSSNTSATRVRDTVGNAALQRLARRVGMRDFATARSWGASRITAADQTRFFLAIDRYVVARHRDYAMRLLSSVIGGQRWGIASVPRPRGWRIHFKGGWVKGRENQVALLENGRRRIALAVLTENSPSSAYGRATQHGVAARLLRGLESGSRVR